MRQGFAITLIIVVLFLLWLVNTGRYERFIRAFASAWEGKDIFGGSEGVGTRQGPSGPVYGVPLPPTSPANPLGGQFGVKPTQFYGSMVPGATFGDGSAMMIPAGEPNEQGASINAAMCASGNYLSCAAIVPDLARYPLNTVKQTLNGNPLTTLGGLIRW